MTWPTSRKLLSPASDPVKDHPPPQRHVRPLTALVGRYLLENGTYVLAPLRAHHFDSRTWYWTCAMCLGRRNLAAGITMMLTLRLLSAFEITSVRGIYPPSVESMDSLVVFLALLGYILEIYIYIYLRLQHSRPVLSHIHVCHPRPRRNKERQGSRQMATSLGIGAAKLARLLAFQKFQGHGPGSLHLQAAIDGVQFLAIIISG